MEAVTKTKKVRHQSDRIQYNDKAIEGLKYNKKNVKRLRKLIKFKNGPVGVSLRWTPKSNKKIFVLDGKVNGKS